MFSRVASLAACCWVVSSSFLFGQEVTSKMPDHFRSDSDDSETTNTSFFLLTGPGGMFNNEAPVTFSDLTDGTSNTVITIEAKRDVHWAKPEDIVIDPNEPLAAFGGFHQGGFHVTMVDSSVRFIPENVDPEILRKMFTPAGGEIADFNDTGDDQ